MSKMIEIKNCEDCKHFASEHVRVGKFYCTHPEMNLADIVNPSKILPNCPLEDYPKPRHEFIKNFLEGKK